MSALSLSSEILHIMIDNVFSDIHPFSYIGVTCIEIVKHCRETADHTQKTRSQYTDRLADVVLTGETLVFLIRRHPNNLSAGEGLSHALVLLTLPKQEKIL